MCECSFFLPKLKTWHKHWKVKQNQLLNLFLYAILETGLKIIYGGLWVPFWPIWRLLNRESLQMFPATWGKSPLYMIMITDCTRITIKTTQHERKEPCIINVIGVAFILTYFEKKLYSLHLFNFWSLSNFQIYD